MKSTSTRGRHELLQRVGMELGRELSTQTVFFHEAIARKLGLNATDTRCLELISRAGRDRVTAGNLAEATGLTTGAVTGILDRLEKAGMVKRERDTNDRRKVYVRPIPEAMRRLGSVYEKLATATMKLASSYQTQELELINDFLQQSLAILKEQIESL